MSKIKAGVFDRRQRTLRLGVRRQQMSTAAVARSKLNAGGGLHNI